MRDLPLLARLSFGLGFVVMLLWAALQTGLIERRSQRGHRHGHAHGAHMPLPHPRYRRSGPGRLIPDYGALPAFSLVDTAGAPLTSERLSGKVWVASFLFTRCGGTCPTTASRNQVLQASLPDGSLLVSISVDPERDTPEVLGKYAEKFGRVPGRWLLATGKKRRIVELAEKGFHLGGAGALFHSTKLALVDRRNHLRGYYESTSEEEMAKLLRDVAMLVADRPAES